MLESPEPFVPVEVLLFVVIRQALNSLTFANPHTRKMKIGIFLDRCSCGFTTLTEYLSRTQAEGAEMMRDALCAYFHELIQIIQSFKGDIVKVSSYEIN